MGQCKGFVSLLGRPMIMHVLDRLEPQVDKVLVSANADIAHYEALGCEVVPDSRYPYKGPLAGIFNALSVIQTDYLLVVPCDMPLLPTDLQSRLYRSLTENSASVAIAHDSQREQPLLALLKREVCASLQYVLDAGEYSVMQWLSEQNYVLAQFSDPSAFMNVNTPNTLKKLEVYLRTMT